MSAAMAYLFQSVQPVVIEEALAQIKQSFPEGLPDPDDLITLHMRWGDKGTETRILPVSHFVWGVKELIEERQRQKPWKNGIHIYLASEDGDAITAFQKAAPKNWIVHTSGPTQLPGQIKSMAEFRSGEHGLKSLAALLVSLQANHYVLVTSSNWSCLINELRLAIVDPRCNGCTTMRDLHYGEWPTMNARTGQLSWGSEFRRPTYSTSPVVVLFSVLGAGAFFFLLKTSPAVEACVAPLWRRFVFKKKQRPRE